MARVNKIETCMFCMCAPCECNKPAAKVPTPRKPRAAVEKPAGSVAAPKAEAFSPEPARRPGPFGGFKSPTEQLVELSEKMASEQVVIAAVNHAAASAHVEALMTLLDARILHRDEIPRAKRMLREARPPTIEAHLQQWKAEHRGKA